MSDRKLYKKVDFKENFKVYLSFAKPYKWLFIIVIILATILEISSLVEKYMFKLILDNGAKFTNSTILRSQISHLFLIIGLVFLGLVFFKSFNHWFRIKIFHKAEVNMMFDLKKKYFDHIVALDHNFHSTHKTGGMIARLNRGTSALEKITDFLIYNIIPLILQFVVIGASLIILERTSAIIILITALCFVIYGLYISSIQKTVHINVNSAEDYEKGYIGDVFSNIDSIKYFGKEDIIINKFSYLSRDTTNKRLIYYNYDRFFSSGQSIILGIGTFLIIYFPLMKFLDGDLTIGTLAFIYSVYGSLMGNLNGFVNGVRGFYIALGDFDELFYYGKIKK